MLAASNCDVTMTDCSRVVSMDAFLAQWCWGQWFNELWNVWQVTSWLTGQGQRARHEIMVLIITQRRGTKKNINVIIQLVKGICLNIKLINIIHQCLCQYLRHLELENSSRHSGRPRTLLGLISLFKLFLWPPVFQHGASLVGVITNPCWDES